MQTLCWREMSFPSAKSGQTGLENGTPICKVGAVCLFYDSTIITVTIIILRLGLLNDQLLIMVYGPNIGHYLVLFIMVTTFRKCCNAFLRKYHIPRKQFKFPYSYFNILHQRWRILNSFLDC